MTVQPAESQSEVHVHVAVALSAQILDSSVVGQWREVVQRRLQLDPNSVDWTWFVSDAAGCSLQLLNSKFDRTARSETRPHTSTHIHVRPWLTRGLRGELLLGRCTLLSQSGAGSAWSVVAQSVYAFVRSAS